MSPKRSSLALAPALALLLGGCASAQLLPEQDRAALAKQWEGRILYCRSSLNVLPFYADTTRRLVSPLPADSIHLLDDTQGAPILPGAVEQVLPLGTKVRLERIEYPTGLVRTRRPLYTPRDNTWVYLSLAGQPRGRPLVAVLRYKVSGREDFSAALTDLFSEDEPSLWLKNVPQDIRAAIEEKRLVSGMDTDAVALSWGRPELITQEVEGGVRLETWTWPLKKRTARFRDGKLASATPALDSRP